MQHSRIPVVETDTHIVYPSTAMLDKVNSVRKEMEALKEFLFFAKHEKKLQMGFDHPSGWVCDLPKYSMKRWSDEERDAMIEDGTIYVKRGVMGIVEYFDKETGKEWTFERFYFEALDPEDRKMKAIIYAHFDLDAKQESDERDAVLLAVQMSAASGKPMKTRLELELQAAGIRRTKGG